ncbi:MAG: hypothetical protein HC906_04665 [Bacteroidales bacterium]|nr:hypothetical protein [Bacteroidales bacterium]
MKLFKRLLILTGILIILGSVFLFLYLITPSPPTELIDEARTALSDAKKSKANIYLEKQYRLANGLYDSIMAEWKYQNSRFF